VAHCCVFFRRYFCLWLISLRRPLVLFALLKDERALDCLPAFVFDRDLFSFQLSLISLGTFWVVKYWCINEMVMEVFSAESLSCPSMKKLVEQIKMGTCTCIQLRVVFFSLWFHCVFTSMVLISYGDTYMVLAMLDQGYGQF
jgi:hypothetical protein